MEGQLENLQTRILEAEQTINNYQTHILLLHNEQQILNNKTQQAYQHIHVLTDRNQNLNFNTTQLQSQINLIRQKKAQVSTKIAASRERLRKLQNELNLTQTDRFREKMRCAVPLAQLSQSLHRILITLENPCGLGPENDEKQTRIDEDAIKLLKELDNLVKNTVPNSLKDLKNAQEIMKTPKCIKCQGNLHQCNEDLFESIQACENGLDTALKTANVTELTRELNDFLQGHVWTQWCKVISENKEI